MPVHSTAASSIKHSPARTQGCVEPDSSLSCFCVARRLTRSTHSLHTEGGESAGRRQRLAQVGFSSHRSGPYMAATAWGWGTEWQSATQAPTLLPRIQRLQNNESVMPTCRRRLHATECSPSPVCGVLRACPPPNALAHLDVALRVLSLHKEAKADATGRAVAVGMQPRWRLHIALKECIVDCQKQKPEPSSTSERPKPLAHSTHPPASERLPPASEPPAPVAAPRCGLPRTAGGQS
jgi:hypothetical protein